LDGNEIHVWAVAPEVSLKAFTAFATTRGEGIAERFREVAIAFLSGEPTRVISPSATPIPAKDWSLHELNPAEEFAAALAASARSFELSCWRWLN
jgi:hypothetical protein